MNATSTAGLDELPSVEPATAATIIDNYPEHEPFQRPEDLLQMRVAIQVSFERRPRDSVGGDCFFLHVNGRQSGQAPQLCGPQKQFVVLTAGYTHSDVISRPTGI